MTLDDFFTEEAAGGAIGASSFAGSRSVLFSNQPDDGLISRKLSSKNPVQTLKIIKISKRKSVAGVPLLTFTREQ